MTRPDHGPDCIACHAPDEAARLLAEDRAALDRQAARARLCRQIGEAFRERTLTTRLGDPRWPVYEALMIRFLGDANGIAQGVRMTRAHLDRVEAAHPHLTGGAPHA